MGNHFSNFFSFYRNAPNFFCIIQIWTFSFQNCFQNQLLTSGSCQTEVRKCAYFHFLNSKIYSKSSFEMRRSMFLFKKIFWIISMKKKLEKKISIVFFKMNLSDVGGYFPIWGLKIDIMVHVYVLKSPRGLISVVCGITHLYPQAIMEGIRLSIKYKCFFQLCKQ